MHADANARCMVCRPLTALDQMAQNHEPTKQREGDQPLPIPTDEEYVQDRIIAKVETLVRSGKMDRGTADGVIAKMEESKRVGMQRYGTALQTFNGRDALQDAEEEARDLFVYLSSLMQAREASREKLVEVVAKDIGRALPTRLDWENVSEERIAEIAVDAILKATGGFQT